jgi:hypothetical protein
MSLTAWSKEFLKTNIRSAPQESTVVDNAAKASEQLALPESLFIELTSEIRAMGLNSSMEYAKEEWLILMGFCIGWKEAQELDSGK